MLAAQPLGLARHNSLRRIMISNSNFPFFSAANQPSPEPTEPIILHSARLQDDLVQEVEVASGPNAKTATDDEKFELLSAYLDDEVSEQERCLVEHWLSADPQLQQHYQAQLRLRQAIRWHGLAEGGQDQDDLLRFSLDGLPIEVFSEPSFLGDSAIAASSWQSDWQNLWQGKRWLVFTMGLMLGITVGIALEIALGATVATLPSRLTTDRLRPAHLR
jgi:hypothetical protein